MCEEESVLQKKIKIKKNQRSDDSEGLNRKPVQKNPQKLVLLCITCASSSPSGK